MDALIIMLYAVGIVLMVAEMLLPGVVLGVAGFIGVVAAIVMAFRSHETMTLGLVLSGIALVLVPAFLIGWLYFAKFVSLRKTQAGTSSADEGLKKLAGQEGIALTNLRPAGTALFGERRVDVVTGGEMIERDTRVRVVRVEGSRVVVRAERV